MGAAEEAEKKRLEDEAARKATEEAEKGEVASDYSMRQFLSAEDNEGAEDEVDKSAAEAHNHMKDAEKLVVQGRGLSEKQMFAMLKKLQKLGKFSLTDVRELAVR